MSSSEIDLLLKQSEHGICDLEIARRNARGDNNTNIIFILHSILLCKLACDGGGGGCRNIIVLDSSPSVSLLPQSHFIN